VCGLWEGLAEKVDEGAASVVSRCGVEGKVDGEATEATECTKPVEDRVLSISQVILMYIELISATEKPLVVNCRRTWEVGESQFLQRACGSMNEPPHILLSSLSVLQLQPLEM